MGLACGLEGELFHTEGLALNEGRILFYSHGVEFDNGSYLGHGLLGHDPLKNIRQFMDKNIF